VKSDKGIVPGHNGAPALVGRIEFRNVRFAYPSRPEALILDDFNLVIEPKQSVALVGPSGSGKSSIILLIQRFYDVQAGQILLDGRDIREYNVRCSSCRAGFSLFSLTSLRFLRELIGTVSQEPQLFAVSVKANIALGKPSSHGPASLEEITAAATAANAHKFIQNLQVCLWQVHCFCLIMIDMPLSTVTTLWWVSVYPQCNSVVGSGSAFALLVA
jgi:ATP-binding cassette subfamily B (MDR/TAP) protein 1